MLFGGFLSLTRCETGAAVPGMPSQHIVLQSYRGNDISRRLHHMPTIFQIKVHRPGQPPTPPRSSYTLHKGEMQRAALSAVVAQHPWMLESTHRLYKSLTKSMFPNHWRINGEYMEN